MTMAKKHQRREHVSVRRKKEEQLKLKKRQDFYAAHKKQIITGIIAVVVAIVLIWVGVDYFYTPGGSIRMFMGNLIGVEENWLVRNMGTTKKPMFFKFGEVDAPEGYTLDAEYNVSSEDREQSFYYNADDETATIQNVYFAGVKEKTGAEMIETVISSGMYASMSEGKTTEIAGMPIQYVYATMNPDSADDTIFSSLLIMYADTVKDSSVLINCTSFRGTEDEIPGEEAMLAAAESLVSCLKLPQ